MSLYFWISRPSVAIAPFILKEWDGYSVQQLLVALHAEICESETFLCVLCVLCVVVSFSAIDLLA